MVQTRERGEPQPRGRPERECLVLPQMARVSGAPRPRAEEEIRESGEIRPRMERRLTTPRPLATGHSAPLRGKPLPLGCGADQS